MPPLPIYEPTPISGLRDPQGNNSAASKPQVDPQLKQLEPSIAPFVTLLANKRNQLPDIAGYKHTWWKKYPFPNQVEVVGAYAAGDTAITLQAGDGAKVAADYTLFNIRTEERIRVSSVVVATDVATCIRNLGGSGGVGMVNGDVLFILGSTREDGAGLGTLLSTLAVEEYNYPEITRTPFGLTGRMLNTERWIGSDMEETQREAWHEHAKQLERKYFYGIRDLRTGTLGKGQNTMGGLADFVRTNVMDMNGNQLTQTSFNEFAGDVLKYGRGGYIGGTGAARKMMFGSHALFQMVSDWAGANVRYAQNDQVVGMDVKEIQTASGTIVLFPSAIFDTVEGLKNQAFIVDLNEIAPANYRGRATRMLSDRQDNDVDAKEFEYFTDQTVEVPIEEAHGRILNIGL